MERTLKNPIEVRNNKIGINENFTKAMLFVYYILPVFAFKNGQLYPYISLIELALMICLMTTSKHYLLYPIVVCFYKQLVAPGDIVLYRVYSLLMVLRFVIDNKNLDFSIPKIIILLTNIFYILFAMMQVQSLSALSVILDFVLIGIISMFYLDNDKDFIEFMKFFVFAIIFSGVAGIFLTSSKTTNITITSDAQYFEYTRFYATFEDPNYLCFFINIALVALLNLPLYKSKLLMAILFIGLVAMIVASASMTGMFTLALVIVYSCINAKPRRKGMFFLLLISIAIIFVYLLSKFVDLGFITTTFARIEDKFLGLFRNKDLGEFTTIRSVLWKQNMDFFINQSIVNLLFGGNQINSVFFNSSVFLGASHQEYIDVLLNVGFIGFVAIFTSIIVLLVRNICDINNSKTAIAKAGIKLVWLFYALGLSMFLDPRFYFFIIL